MTSVLHGLDQSLIPYHVSVWLQFHDLDFDERLELHVFLFYQVIGV